MPSVDLVMSEDTFLRDSSATTNFNANTSLSIGEHNAAATIDRTLIKPDFSSVPTDAIFKTAILKLTPITDLSSNAAVVYCHRVTKDVVYSQATWTVYATAANWVLPGCSSTAGFHGASGDYDGSVVMGNMSVDASPTLNVQLEMTLDAAELRKLFDGTYTNNGMVLFTEDQTNDLIQYASTNHATSAYRPIITLTYALPGGAAAFF